MTYDRVKKLRGRRIEITRFTKSIAESKVSNPCNEMEDFFVREERSVDGAPNTANKTGSLSIVTVCDMLPKVCH